MFLEITTPDQKVFEGEVDSATFPGSDGSFQVLNDHTPLVSSMAKGDIKIVTKHENKVKEVHIAITGGVVEVLNNRVQALVESIVT